MGLTVTRFVIAFVPLLVPTLLMGATLPILSRIVVRQLSRVERELGRLYAINTVGAVSGSLAAGFLLIRVLGLHGTIYAAVAGNLAVGVLAWLASLRYGTDAAASPDASPHAPTVASAPADPASRRTCRMVLGAFALSGFASFAYEVFWTRSLVFVVGNTTYAFTLMLTSFLSGIALGGYGIRFVADRVNSPLRLFATLEVLIGLLSAATLPLLFAVTRSDTIRDFVTSMSGQMGFLALSDFGVALVLMLIPATLIGATFPLLGRVFLDDLASTGSTVGKVYAVNTVGNVLGALLPGLLILPVMGIQKGILLMAVLNVFLGIVILLSRWKHATAAAAVLAAAFLAFAVLFVRLPFPFQFPSEYQTAKDEVLYYKEGGLVTTKVWQSADTDYKLISVDGINIGGTSDSDYKQQILAHLPKLLLKSYSSELSIGLGSGIVAGESTRHQALKKMVCVEISKGVVAGSRYFTKENYGVVDDPRTTMVTDDIADYLQTSSERFDIISADEKTAGKFATNSMSYSREYYDLLRKHLAPEGLVIQWMPADLPPTQYTLALRTFLESFPHATLWYFPPVGRFTMPNTFLVGSAEQLAIDPAWMRQALAADPTAFQGMRKYGLTTAEAVLAHLVASGETLRRALPPGPVNSFEHPYYEFYSPRDYAVPAPERTLANLGLLMACRGSDLAGLAESAPADAASLNRAFRAEGLFLQGHLLELRGTEAPTVLRQYEEALAAAPGDRNLANEVVAYLTGRAKERGGAGDYAQALAFSRRAAEVFPEGSEVHYDLGLMLLFVKETDLALQELQRALALDPQNVPALRNIGVVYAMRDQMDRAMAEWRQALAIDPNDVKSLVFCGTWLTERGAVAEGMEYLRRASRLAPENPDVSGRYARARHQQVS